MPKQTRATRICWSPLTPSPLLTTGSGCPSSLCFTLMLTESGWTWLGEQEYLPACAMVTELMVRVEVRVRLVTGVK